MCKDSSVTYGCTCSSADFIPYFLVLVTGILMCGCFDIETNVLDALSLEKKCVIHWLNHLRVSNGSIFSYLYLHARQ
jgi:hypothetical protein